MVNNESAMIFSAPGRTEICGNHTDHQHGKVLAAAINLDTRAVVRPNADNVIRINSEACKILTYSCRTTFFFNVSNVLISEVLKSCKYRISC